MLVLTIPDSEGFLQVKAPLKYTIDQQAVEKGAIAYSASEVSNGVSCCRGCGARGRLK